MFSIVCFAIAITVIAVFAFLAFRKRNNMSEAISCILFGTFLSTFFMVLPTDWVKGKAVSCEPLYAVVSSLFYSLKAVGGGQDVTQLETMALPGIWKTVYIVINYICSILSPIFASSLILSFVGDVGEKMRLALRFCRKHIIFSEINENALSLAKAIKNKPGRKAIVFCDGKHAEKNMIVKAKELGAVVLNKPCDCIKFNRFKIYEFCLIAGDEDQNIHLAETIVAKYDANKKARVLINAFVESGTNVNFLESVVRAKGEDANIELHCIDEIALFCNHLIFDHPLYNTKDNGNNISVAIIGCGRTGMRMLKTVYWAGQIDGYSLKIRVYDKNADECEAAFYRQCPGLKEEKCIRFIQADVDSYEFKEQLLKPENSADATYIVATMDDDQRNLSVADELYSIYRIHRNFRDERMPEIFARVRSQAKTGAYLNNNEFLDARRIHLFGTTASVFSDKTLFDSELENLALAVHLVYRKSLGLDRNSDAYRKKVKEFQSSEYDRRSSMAVALHIPTKLCMCEGIPKTGENMLTAENVRLFRECVKRDPTLIMRLAENEHTRWNAFMLSEGYQTVTIEQMHLYAQSVDAHKDELSMLHPCITAWEALDDLQNIYNSTYHKDKKFKYYDKTIVEKIPQMWEFARERNGEK